MKSQVPQVAITDANGEERDTGWQAPETLDNQIHTANSSPQL